MTCCWNEMRNVVTVLDVGCGVASFGAYLLKFDIFAISLAPSDLHQNQIQFALERGIPIYLGVLEQRDFLTQADLLNLHIVLVVELIGCGGMGSFFLNWIGFLDLEAIFPTRPLKLMHGMKKT
ncbi:probable methyltransferase PMT3 [Olea europaea subsp. europaea]|uniref:Methyltransferase n=1 Tax=Olea europaea subsp. europaea TaxID=158383 RepID=A0A8S0PA67_OLEEU|nr:probable methyltransferase PMT3 [Olea europaea subsp. europaea]